MESEHGSKSKEHTSKNATNSKYKDDALAPLISYHESESEADSDTNFNEKTSDSVGMLEKSSAIPTGSPKAQEVSQSPKKKDTPGDTSYESDQDLNDIAPGDSSSQVSQGAGGSTLQTMSPVQSPPVQVMEKSGDYDPDRIPASVFGSRPSSAKDWSVASNDSLFSLQLGNSSFSREQFLMMGGDMFGEESHKSEELYTSGELTKPDEAGKSKLPPLSPVGKLRKVNTMDADKKAKQAKAGDETTKHTSQQDVLEEFQETENEVEGHGNSSMFNRPSDGSVASCQSFAFPILVDTTKSSSGKGPSPRQQYPKLQIYEESPKMKAHATNSSSHWWCCCSCPCNSCSLPHWSCLSCWHCHHCWSWSWYKKWCNKCCCCCCCYS